MAARYHIVGYHGGISWSSAAYAMISAAKVRTPKESRTRSTTFPLYVVILYMMIWVSRPLKLSEAVVDFANSDAINLSDLVNLFTTYMDSCKTPDLPTSYHNCANDRSGIM